MAIDFSDTFTKLGKLGKVINNINTYRGTTNPGLVADVFTEYAGSEDLIPNLENDNESAQDSYGSFVSSLQQIGQNTVVSVVNTDNPQPNTTLNTALDELIRQMVAGTESIAQNTTGVTNTAGGSNLGNGAINVSLKSSDGHTLQMPYAEDIITLCTADGQTGAVAGNERFTVAGEFAANDPFNPAWPAGSGSSANIVAINAATNNASGNLIVNGAMETFTVANTPDNWTILNGAAGTEIFKESSTKYAGSFGLKYVSTATDPKISQTFGDSTNGTGSTLKPLTTYSVSFWVRADSVPASGTLTVRLYDVTGSAVMNDASSTANQLVVNLNTLTTSFVNKTAVFRTPRTLPASYRLEILCNSIPSSRSIYIDHISFGAMTQLYNNGPAVAIHAGALPFIADDYFSSVVANNYASAWATMAEKMFSLNQNGLILPYSGSPTQADSLLS